MESCVAAEPRSRVLATVSCERYGHERVSWRTGRDRREFALRRTSYYPESDLTPIVPADVEDINFESLSVAKGSAMATPSGATIFRETSFEKQRLAA
jgi:hypothetical protein